MMINPTIFGGSLLSNLRKMLVGPTRAYVYHLRQPYLVAPSQDPTIGSKKAVEMGRKKHIVTYYIGLVSSLKLTYAPKIPENRPLEKEIPIGNHHFQGRAVSFRESVMEYSDEKSRYTSPMFNFNKV